MTSEKYMRLIAERHAIDATDAESAAWATRPWLADPAYIRHRCNVIAALESWALANELRWVDPFVCVDADGLLDAEWIAMGHRIGLFADDDGTHYVSRAAKLPFTDLCLRNADIEDLAALKDAYRWFIEYRP